MATSPCLHDPRAGAVEVQATTEGMPLRELLPPQGFARLVKEVHALGHDQEMLLPRTALPIAAQHLADMASRTK